MPRGTPPFSPASSIGSTGRATSWPSAWPRGTCWHAPALAELEDGGRDHRAPGAARSRRSGEVRLRAVSHAHGRRLPRPPRPGGVPAVRTARGLPSLEAGRGPPEASMTEITGILLGALLVVLAVVAWTLFAARRELAQMRSQPPVPDPSVALLRQEIESVRHEGREDQEHLRREVGALTGEVTRQLEEGMKLIHAGQTSIGARLDAATKVVGDVQGSLGTLQEATRRVAEIGREIQGLEQVLKSPKMRGGLGETLLERLLDEMLPREHWTTQHGFRSGEKVDAAITIGERIVPVDAKFPLENFRRMLGESDDAQKQYEDAQRELDRLETKLDEIGRKGAATELGEAPPEPPTLPGVV